MILLAALRLYEEESCQICQGLIQCFLATYRHLQRTCCPSTSFSKPHSKCKANGIVIINERGFLELLYKKRAGQKPDLVALTCIPSPRGSETKDHLCHEDTLPRNTMSPSQQFQQQDHRRKSSTRHQRTRKPLPGSRQELEAGVLPQ